jgi:ketosteroid isomerase-like protein
MPATTADTEILQLEKRYWDAMKARDQATIDALTADPCLVVGPQGARMVDRQEFTRMFQSDDWKVLDYKLDERNASVRPISNDVAVVAYNVKERAQMGGQPQDIDAYDTSVWARQNGKWQCVAHTESPAAPPAKR